MTCYRKGGCGPYEMYSCNDCPASKESYLKRSCENCGSKEYRGDTPNVCIHWKGSKARLESIHSMSAEEFAKWLDEEFGRASWCDVDALINERCENKPCVECIVKWLNEEEK